VTRRKLERGTVVLADDPHCAASGRRPFVIISDESYPFYPSGYLGIPMTRKDKTNTFELTDYDIVEQYEEFEKDDNFINPYSPHQVNDPHEKLCLIDESFINILTDRVTKAIGVKTTA
jgi:hypothetical protein